MNDDQNMVGDDEPLAPEAKSFPETHEGDSPEVEEEKRIRFLFNGEEMSLYDFKVGIMNYDETATPAVLQRWSAALRSLKPGQSLDLKELGGDGLVTRVAVS